MFSLYHSHDRDVNMCIKQLLLNKSLDCYHHFLILDIVVDVTFVRIKQKRTGDTEEVSHHKVGRPGCLQLEQAVKYIEGVLALLLNDRIDLSTNHSCDQWQKILS